MIFPMHTEPQYNSGGGVDEMVMKNLPWATVIDFWNSGHRDNGINGLVKMNKSTMFGLQKQMMGTKHMQEPERRRDETCTITNHKEGSERKVEVSGETSMGEQLRGLQVFGN